MAKKRNANGQGSVRHRKDGRWEARCTINGKSRSFYADKQSDAISKMQEAQQDAAEGLFLEPSKSTVEEWLTVWLEEYLKPTVKPSTYHNTLNRVRKHIIPAFIGRKLQQLNATHVQRFYNSLQAKLARSSIQVIHANLHAALEQAVKLGYIRFNPTRHCTLPKARQEERNPFSDSELGDFLAELDSFNFKGLPLKNYFKVALFTGMRKGELCGLSWSDVNFKSGTITVRQQLCQESGNSKKFYLSSPKNGRKRTLTPPPFVFELLRETKREQVLNQLAAGTSWKNVDNLVFTTQTGEYLRGSRAYTYFKRIVRKIGRPDLRLHDTRHTYTAIALQEGDSPITVQSALGHATAKFTLEVYAHVSEKMNIESANRMQKYYEKLQG